jgi:hypothetical protein
MNDRTTALAWLFGWCFAWMIVQSIWNRNCISHERLAIIKECADRPKVIYDYGSGAMGTTQNTTISSWTYVR